MFFLIGGVQPKKVTLEKTGESCPECGHQGLETKRIDHYFSLFFIPLFPVKKGISFKECPNCRTKIPPEDLSSGDVGSGTNRMRCGTCGQPYLKSDFLYCPYCGKARKRWFRR